MTIEQFGQSIKQKYPQYQDLSDAELGQKMLAKYPQYQDMIDPPKIETGRAWRQSLPSYWFLPPQSTA